MKRVVLALGALVIVAASASAQDPFTEAKKKAMGAKAAADAHTEAMQKPEAQPAKPAAKPAAAAPRQGAALPAATAKPGTQLNVVKSDTGGPPPTIYREVFQYARDGRRDPFVSLLTTNELRPAMSDLRLTGILYDNTRPDRSIATLRDLTNNAQYRVSVGSPLGRMRVTAIRTMAVIFTIEEFGTTRRDSLVLRDSTNKARAK